MVNFHKKVIYKIIDDLSIPSIDFNQINVHLNIKFINDNDLPLIQLVIEYLLNDKIVKIHNDLYDDHYRILRSSVEDEIIISTAYFMVLLNILIPAKIKLTFNNTLFNTKTIMQEVNDFIHQFKLYDLKYLIEDAKYPSGIKINNNPSKLDSPCFVYVFNTPGTFHYKIGYSNDVDERYADLLIGCSLGLNIIKTYQLKTIPIAVDFEDFLHSRYKDYKIMYNGKVRKEWFEFKDITQILYDIDLLLHNKEFKGESIENILVN